MGGISSVSLLTGRVSCWLTWFCRIEVVFVFRRSKAHLKVERFHNHDHHTSPRFLGLKAELKATR